MGLTADMKTLLTSVSSNIYRNEIPDTPNDCVALFDTGGYDPVHSLGVSGPTYEQPTFQVRIRNAVYDTGITKCEAIKTALDGVTNRVINGRTYISIFQMGDTLSLGRDDRGRSQFSLNFAVKVKR